MPKQKTHKGLAKRVKIGAKGAIKFGRVGKGHLNAHKAAKRKRKLNRTGVLHHTEEAKVVRLMLGQR